MKKFCQLILRSKNIEYKEDIKLIIQTDQIWMLDQKNINIQVIFQNISQESYKLVEPSSYQTPLLFQIINKLTKEPLRYIGPKLKANYVNYNLMGGKQKTFVILISDDGDLLYNLNRGTFTIQAFYYHPYVDRIKIASNIIDVDIL